MNEGRIRQCSQDFVSHTIPVMSPPPLPAAPGHPTFCTGSYMYRQLYVLHPPCIHPCLLSPVLLWPGENRTAGRISRAFNPVLGGLHRNLSTAILSGIAPETHIPWSIYVSSCSDGNSSDNETVQPHPTIISFPPSIRLLPYIPPCLLPCLSISLSVCLSAPLPPPPSPPTPSLLPSRLPILGRNLLIFRSLICSFLLCCFRVLLKVHRL